MIKEIIFALITLFSFGFLGYNLNRFRKILKFCKEDNRTDKFAKRLRNVFKVALFQSKILREPIAGVVHVLIFWGFLALLFSASESVFQGFYQHFSWSFLGPFYAVISFSNDVFCIFVLLAVLISLSRRYIFRIKRLQGNREEMIDAFMVLFSIFIIVLALLLQNAAKIASGITEEYSYQPFAKILSGFFIKDHSQFFYEIFWWLHILWIYFFMNFLFYSKHFHVFTSIQNVFFRDPIFFFKPSRINFEAENVEKFGVLDFEDLSWKSVYDG
ncbi:MAG: Fe-S oxidoreductase, partial [Candidatus Kapaibacteriota bacterium]